MNLNKIQTRRVFLITVLVMISLALIYYGIFTYVKSNPGGADFLAQWQGARLVLKGGENPYSDTSAGQINQLIKDQGIKADGEYRFLLPLFSIFISVPLALIKDPMIGRAVWMTIQFSLLVFSGYLVLNWMRWKKTALTFLFLMAILVFSVPAFHSLLSGSMTIVSFALIIASITLIIKQQDQAAGLLLAFSLVKPDLVYMIVIVLLLWAGIRKRPYIIWWFAGTFILLMGFSILLLPNWPLDYVQNIVKFSGNNPIQQNATPLNAMTLRLLIAKNLLLTILVLYEWLVIKIDGNKRLIWNIALLLVISPWIGRSTIIENTILIIPALFTGLGLLVKVWKDKAKITIILLPFLIFVLSWVFSGTFISGISLRWSTLILTGLIPAIVLVIIYWSRWWVIRTEKFDLDGILAP